jgi:hypothetical protein
MTNEQLDDKDVENDRDQRDSERSIKQDTPSVSSRLIHHGLEQLRDTHT